MDNLISSLKVYFTKKILVILLLGFASGIPLALTASVLKVWLLEEGVNIRTIGLFALVGIPYTFKFLWAPLIDNISIPILKNLGRRRSWLIITQFGLVICLTGIGYSGAIGNLKLISFFAIVTAFFSASQDIVVDAYRIESLKDDEQGAGAGIYVYGYRIAMLVSGAGSLILADNIEWRIVYMIMAGIMLFMILISLLIKEPEVKVYVQNDKSLWIWFKDSVISPFTDFMKKDKWLIVLLFIVFYKFCDAFAGNLTATFLRDIGFEKSEIAMVAQTLGLVATLLGVLIGGLMTKTISIVKALWIGGILQAVSNLVFVMQANVGADIRYLFATIGIENLTGGIGTAVFLAYLATLCNKKYTATQYALLTSLTATGRAFLSSSAGYFVDAMGWEKFFLLTVFFSIPGFVFLCWMTRCWEKRDLKG